MPTREAILARSAALTETAEQRAARQVAAAYNQARRELLATLLEGWTGSSVMTPDDAARLLRQSGLLQQIDARLLQLEREVGVTLRGIVTDSTERALDGMRRELALLPPDLRPRDLDMFGTINSRMIEQYAPLAMSDWHGLTVSMSTNLQRELQVGLIQGEAFPTLSTRLLRQAPGDGPGAVFPRAQTSADLATRRLVIAAENGAKQAAIAEVAQSIPLIQKQAIAAIGKNTTDCCLRVHGQIVDNDKPFELVGEPRFADELMTSPFHWNCRTSIAMYHPFFEQAMPTAKLKADAARELKKREEEKSGKKRDEGAARPARPAPDINIGPRSVTRSGSTATATAEPSAPIPIPPRDEVAIREATRRAESARAEAEAARVAAEVKRTEADAARRRAEEMAAAARSAPYQYTPSQQQIARVESNVDRYVKRVAQEKRQTVAQVEAQLQETVRRIASEHDLAIQFKSERLDRFLSDPRFKTQFETNSSGGTLDKQYRADAEYAGLGAPLDLDPKRRPIYGYMNMGKAAQDRVAQYGDITFILKGDVRQRTTITAGDSLYNMKSGYVAGTPVSQPGKASWDTGVEALYNYAQDGNVERLVQRIGYAEIQIQGGVGIGDVRAVIDRTGALTARQRKRLSDLGVEVWDN